MPVCAGEEDEAAAGEDDEDNAASPGWPPVLPSVPDPCVSSGEVVELGGADSRGVESEGLEVVAGEDELAAAELGAEPSPVLSPPEQSESSIRICKFGP